jgi:pimeloyl-ACP methyl ester carboxylesterase
MIADPARLDAQALAIQDWNSRHARFDSRPIGMGSLLPAELRKLDIPITGIWGEQDHAVRGSLDKVEATLRAIRPEMPFHVVPAAGHWVAYEAPDAFAAILRALLAAP